MPSYDYHCASCGEDFARRESVAEHERATRVTCPKCRSVRVERVFAPFFAKTTRKS